MDNSIHDILRNSFILFPLFCRPFMLDPEAKLIDGFAMCVVCVSVTEDEIYTKW